MVCSDPRLKVCYPAVANRDSILDVSMGLAIQNLHLATSALGLGSSWGTVEDKELENVLRSILDIPDFIRVLETISIGYPDDPRPHTYRRSLKEVMHLERFDKSKLRTEGEIKERLTKRKKPDIYST